MASKGDISLVTQCIMMFGYRYCHCPDRGSTPYSCPRHKINNDFKLMCEIKEIIYILDHINFSYRYQYCGTVNNLIQNGYKIDNGSIRTFNPDLLLAQLAGLAGLGLSNRQVEIFLNYMTRTRCSSSNGSIYGV